ncbi:MAG: CoA transferase [Solirubrobacterales bacterium]|nr:CoA transferase [Solirubrobacterales bacterium]
MEAPGDGALAGVTVVSVEQAVAAPLATRHLADLGARVIKVERPGRGDFARDYDTTVNGLSSHFVWLNRGKESLVLDLKEEGDRAVLAKLIARCDVFVQNLAPLATRKLGLDAGTVHAEHPSVIACSVSGYGLDGPYRDKKAYDLLIQSEGGLVSITGTPEAPAKAGISIADIAAGMYAFSGILAALYERERSGEGAALEVSLFDALAEWMGYPAYFTRYGGSQPVRAGASHAAIAPYGPFAAADGKDIVIAVQDEREWAAFCETVLQAPELAGDARFATNRDRVERRSELDAVVSERFASAPGEELLRRLDEANIASARERSIKEFLEHPQLVERDRWRSIGSPAGEIEALLPPVDWHGRAPVMGDVPELDAHGDAIRGELERGDHGGPNGGGTR